MDHKETETYSDVNLWGGNLFLDAELGRVEDCTAGVNVLLNSVDVPHVNVAAESTGLESEACVFIPPVSECGRVVEIA